MVEEILEVEGVEGVEVVDHMILVLPRKLSVSSAKCSANKWPRPGLPPVCIFCIVRGSNRVQPRHNPVITPSVGLAVFFIKFTKIPDPRCAKIYFRMSCNANQYSL